MANTEITQWKSKFDAEVMLHHEEVEDLRKKMLQKQAEYEEQIEIMLTKLSQLEKAKSRLQSEVEVLIVDLEKAQNSIAILERAKEQLEKLVSDLKIKLEDVQAELEATQRELKNVTAEFLKIKHLYEKVVEQKEALARENKKLQGGRTCYRSTTMHPQMTCTRRRRRWPMPTASCTSSTWRTRVWRARFANCRRP